MKKTNNTSPGCCCGGGFCSGGLGCGCGVGFAIAPGFLGYSYSGTVAPETSFVGALKFDLKGSSKQEPSSFWQRHFEGMQTIEQLSYFDFFDRIRATLCQLGFKKMVDIKLGHNEVYNHKMSSDTVDDLEMGIPTAQSELGSGKAELHKAEVNVVKKTDLFHEHLVISYSKKHDSSKQAFCVYSEFAPNDAVWKKTESMRDFVGRLDAKYSLAATTDFLNLYSKLQNLFPLSMDDQALHLEDIDGNPIPFTQDSRVNFVARMRI